MTTVTQPPEKARCSPDGPWDGNTSGPSGTPLRSAATPPALPRRQPPDQPGAAHHAVVQLRHRTEGRAYYDARKAAGKTSMEAMRCLIGGLSVWRSGQPDRVPRVAAGDGLVAGPWWRPVWVLPPLPRRGPV